jgi:glycosyltransferase involved in cell wall biosynthesis
MRAPTRPPGTVVAEVLPRARRRARQALRRVLREARRGRRTLFVYRRLLTRRLRGQRRYLQRRYLRPLARDLRAARNASAVGRRKALFGTPLRADLRALRTWRGETPRVALRNHFNHPVWSTYRTHPPLPFAPSPIAQLDHWINLLPEQSVHHGEVSSSRAARRRAARPHVLEVEHWALLMGLKGDGMLHYDERKRADARVRADECRAVVTLSRGLVEHFRQFLAPDVWAKIEYAFPAYPSQPEDGARSDEVFTIMAIGNRFSDKGLPEALSAFEVLRQRHGRRVRMVLVSATVGLGRQLPDGVVLCSTLRMTPKLKTSVYRSADVLVVPAYTDTLGNYPEACAFGLPMVATRIHHGEDFVRDGESGYLIESPMYAYSEGFGTRWRSGAEFMAELERKRESGQLAGVVQDLVDRLELMLSGGVDLDDLRAGARRLHAERFSPGVRNARLNAIYARALDR